VRRAAPIWFWIKIASAFTAALLHVTVDMHLLSSFTIVATATATLSHATILPARDLSNTGLTTRDDKNTTIAAPVVAAPSEHWYALTLSDDSSMFYS
jgi:hypothetical protein